MKAIRTLLVGMMMLVSTSIVAQPMNYNAIRNNARFLTDRMAYTLGIGTAAIIDDLYRINYDYIYGINEYLDDIALGYRYDDYMAICAERDYALQMLLGDVLWSRLIGYDYFYRPIIFENHRWRFGIYAYDWHRDHFYFGAPRYFSGYRGGHFFGGMRPHGGLIGRGPGMANWHGRAGGAAGPGMNPGGAYRGGMNNRSGNHGMNQGGNMNHGNQGDMNQGGNMNHGNQGGNMNHGNQGGMNQGGNTNHGNQGIMNQGSGRSESNMRSSSRSGNMSGSSRSSSYNRGNTYSRSSSFGGATTRNSNVGTSRSSSRSSVGSSSRSSSSSMSRGSSSFGGSSRGSSMSSGSRGSSMSSGSRGGSFGGSHSSGGSRGGNSGGGRGHR